jgi:hypothetical protein
MKTITGRFTRYDGTPAAYGVLKLELVSEEGELHELVPFGEAAASLQIPDEEFRQDWRDEQRRFGCTEEEIAKEETVRFQPEYDIHRIREMQVDLDADGRIPIGTVVVGNDELSGRTFYRASVDLPQHLCPGLSTTCFKEEIRIAGDEPVDIHDAVIREPEPEVPPPTPRELELAADAAIVRDGTPRFGKKNRIGFYAGTIHCPTSNAGSVTVPALDTGVFGVLAFHLPMAALVNRVSVLIEAASKGTLFIALYDASGRKHCETGVDLSQSGPASGIFPTAVNLSEGDYFIAWATRTTCGAQLRCLGVLDQLNLMNASGAPVMGIGRAAPGGALPDTLGRIRTGGPHSSYGQTFGPILAYLKG